MKSALLHKLNRMSDIAVTNKDTRFVYLVIKKVNLNRALNIVDLMWLNRIWKTQVI